MPIHNACLLLAALAISNQVELAQLQRQEKSVAALWQLFFQTPYLTVRQTFTELLSLHERAHLLPPFAHFAPLVHSPPINPLHLPPGASTTRRSEHGARRPEDRRDSLQISLELIVTDV